MPKRSLTQMFALAILAVGLTGNAFGQQKAPRPTRPTPLQAAETRAAQAEAEQARLEADARVARAEAATRLAKAELDAVNKLAAAQAETAKAKLDSEKEVAKVKADEAEKLAAAKLAAQMQLTEAANKAVENERQMRLNAETQAAALQANADKDMEGDVDVSFFHIRVHGRRAHNLPKKEKKK